LRTLWAVDEGADRSSPCALGCLSSKWRYRFSFRRTQDIRGTTVRQIRTMLAAALFTCVGAFEVSAESEPTWDDFKAVDRIGTAWAYSAFLQRYPTSDYADRARERIARIAGLWPVADLSRTRTGIIGVPRAPAIDSRRVQEPNYGDAYFMRRHLPLQHWQR
jgi:hypothetical protein